MAAEEISAEVVSNFLLDSLMEQAQPKSFGTAAMRMILRPELAGRRVKIRPRGSLLTAELVEEIPGSFLAGASRGAWRLLQGYACGEWSSDDLYQLLLVLFRTEHQLRKIASPLLAVDSMRAVVRLAVKPQDYVNIVAHYDLPLEIFEASLGSTMAYSAARTSSNPDKVEAAYDDTYRQILSKLKLPGTGSRILDLGAGWGAFAEYVLRESTHSVSTVTLSARQRSYIEARLAAFGTDRFSAVCGDFRAPASLPRHADAVVMIESIEHLHPLDRRSFLRLLRGLYPTAVIFLQFTVVQGWNRLQRLGREAPVTSMIFPGPGEIPALREVAFDAGRAGYRVTYAAELTAEYHSIVLRWAADFKSAMPELARRYPDPLLRAWEFYLVGMAAAFATDTLASHQLVLEP